MASGHNTDLGNIEQLDHLGLSNEFLGVSWFEQPHHSLLDIVDGLIDDRIVSNIHTLLIRQSQRLHPRSDIEPNDDGIRGWGQIDITLCDPTYTAMNDVDLYRVGR